MKLFRKELKDTGLVLEAKFADLNALLLAMQLILSNEEFNDFISDIEKNVREFPDRWARGVKEIMEERGIPEDEAQNIFWQKRVLGPVVSRYNDIKFQQNIARELTLLFPTLKREGYVLYDPENKIGRLNMDIEIIGDLVAALISFSFSPPEEKPAPAPAPQPVVLSPPLSTPSVLQYRKGSESISFPNIGLMGAVAQSNIDDPFET